MGRAGIRRRREKIHRARVPWVPHIDDGDPVAEHVTDEGMTLMDHDLHPVAAPALVAAADEVDVARRYGNHRKAPQPAGFCLKYSASSGRGFQCGVARPFLGPAGHAIAIAHAEQEGPLRAVDVLVQLAAWMDDERARLDRDDLARRAHRAPAFEAEVDLGRVGVAVIGAGLTRLPAGDGDIAFPGGAEHPFQMLFRIERLLGL